MRIATFISYGAAVFTIGIFQGMWLDKPVFPLMLILTAITVGAHILETLK